MLFAVISVNSEHIVIMLTENVIQLPITQTAGHESNSLSNIHLVLKVKFFPSVTVSMWYKLSNQCVIK